jgi:hypothetical protein
MLELANKVGARSFVQCHQCCGLVKGEASFPCWLVLPSSVRHAWSRNVMVLNCRVCHWVDSGCCLMKLWVTHVYTWVTWVDHKPICMMVAMFDFDVS